MGYVIAIISQRSRTIQVSRNILNSISIITIDISINGFVIMKRRRKIGFNIYFMIRNFGNTL